MTIKEVNATGDAVANKAVLLGLNLSAAAAAATAEIRDGSGGAVLLTLKAPVNDSRERTFHKPVTFGSAIHVTLTGAGALLHVEYEP